MIIMEKQKKGTAILSQSKRKEIASAGGRAVYQKLGRKHFQEIGKRGGLKLSQNKAHMSEIGKKGGASRRQAKMDKGD